MQEKSTIAPALFGSLHFFAASFKNFKNERFQPSRRTILSAAITCAAADAWCISICALAIATPAVPLASSRAARTSAVYLGRSWLDVLRRC